ncbi:MAG: hypothetical protein IJ769_11295 [Clostridia bacterium]|nr:hypothetical protein [Clostridia bacterium]
MSTLRDWARRKNRELHRQALEDRDSRLWHSRSYHRYFEGYTEYKELDQNGKERIRRVYAADWYQQDLPKGKRIGVRLLYSLLFLMMVAAVVGAGILQGGAGTRFYIVIPELVTLCLLSWLGYVLLVNYLFMPKKLTVHEYKASSLTLRIVTLAAAVAFAADALMAALDLALVGGARGGWAIALFLAGAACAWVMRLVESRIHYDQIENPAAARDGGVTIESE